MVFGQPVAGVSELVGPPGERKRLVKRFHPGSAGPNGRLIQDAEGNGW